MPVPDPDTRSWQSGAFGSALLDLNVDVPGELRDHLHRKAGKRFDVYRNNVVSSLMEALRRVYPSLVAIMGEANFNIVARIFVTRHPPRDAMMASYGAGFDNFLESFTPLYKSPFLADVARAERAWLDAYHAPDLAPLAGDALLALQPDALVDQAFTVHPATWLLQSAYPVADLFAYRSEVPAHGVNLDEAQCLLITRPVLDVEVRSLDPAGAAFFAALMNGHALGQAIEEHIAIEPETDLGQLITLLLASGAFTAARTSLHPIEPGTRGDPS